MAPIVIAKGKIDSNNNNSSESNNRLSARASTLSREKPGSSGTGTGVKPRGLTLEKKEPADPERTNKPSSASSSTSSSRSQKAVPSKSSKEPPTKATAARKDVKTPPSSAGAPAHPKEEKAVKLHPLPSAQLTKHKQAAVFTSGKKKHKRWISWGTMMSFWSTDVCFAPVTLEALTTRALFPAASTTAASRTH